MSNESTIQIPIDSDDWRLVTDNVMGGVSSGSMQHLQVKDSQCIALQGNVSTENNGGFIQVAIDIDESLRKQLNQNGGVVLTLKGNGEQYNLHLRTSSLWFPWQSYRYSFETDGSWQTIKMPFKEFTAYKTSTEFNPAKISRLGVVAIGRDFQADLCFNSVSFY